MRTLYGPVDSWRFGHSLGVDPLAGREKRCPFSCIYCQYGQTARPTTRRQAFVSAARLESEIESLGPVRADTVTFAGLGEPTLAANLAALVTVVRRRFSQPVIVLTGSGLMPREDVRRDLLAFDVVVAKVDAPDEALFRQINRPGAGFSYPLTAILQAIRRFRVAFAGRLVLQMMFVQANLHAAAGMAQIARSLEPDQVQLCTPLQPALGGPISAEQMRGVETAFAGLEVKSIYQDGQARIRARLP